MGCVGVRLAASMVLLGCRVGNWGILPGIMYTPALFLPSKLPDVLNSVTFLVTLFPLETKALVFDGKVNKGEAA